MIRKGQVLGITRNSPHTWPKGSGIGRIGLAGVHQTPAEVVLRMLILKRVRSWSYETLEREVCAYVVGMEKVPDAKDSGATGTSGWSGGDPRIA